MKFCLDCQKPKSRKGNYCKPCGYNHRIRPKGLKYVLYKENPTAFKKGHVPANKGKRSKFMGRSYDGLHDWVERNLGKAKDGICEKCGSVRNLQWSNKSGRYMRDLKDWQRYCQKCHSRYDYDNFKARKAFYR